MITLAVWAAVGLTFSIGLGMATGAVLRATRQHYAVYPD